MENIEYNREFYVVVEPNSTWKIAEGVELINSTDKKFVIEKVDTGINIDLV